MCDTDTDTDITALTLLGWNCGLTGTSANATSLCQVACVACGNARVTEWRRFLLALFRFGFGETDF